MTPGPGIEPGTHWWKASALTTAPTLLSLLVQNVRVFPQSKLDSEINASFLLNKHGDLCFLLHKNVVILSTSIFQKYKKICRKEKKI